MLIHEEAAYRPFDAQVQWTAITDVLGDIDQDIASVLQAWEALQPADLIDLAQRFKLEADLSGNEKHQQIAKFAQKRLNQIHGHHQSAPDVLPDLPLVSLPPAVQLLCFNAYFNAPGQQPGTRLHSMIDPTVPEEERSLLLSMDVDLNAPDADGNTALHLAVVKGMEHTVQSLLQSGADVNVQNLEGMTPLMLAIGRFNEAIVRLLLREDQLELELRNAQGDTALNYCARIDNGHRPQECEGYKREALRIARALIEKGAQVNTQNNMGDNPLHQCGRRKYGKTSLYALLKARGGDDSIRNAAGERPFCRWYYDPVWWMFGAFGVPIPFLALPHIANGLGKGKWWV